MRNFLKNSFWSLLAISFFFSQNSYSATVNSAVITTGINFGKIVPGTSAATMTTTTCSPTNGAKMLTASGCTNGMITIQATTSAANNNGRRIIVFFNTRPTSLAGSPSGTLASTFTITSPLPSGCTQTTAGTTLTCTDTGGAIGNVRTWNIPVYGTLSSITTTQATGNYAANYGIKACSCCIGTNNPITGCINGCPTNLTSDARCTNANLFKGITGSIPARIVTPLSVVQTSILQFGTVASSVASGFILQDGTTSGGVTAVSGGATRSAGQFNVTGESGGTTYNYTITLSATSTLTGPGANMTANLSLTPTSVTLSPAPTTTLTKQLNVAGTDTISIYGRLGINANQAPGNYTGTYNVTVAY